jgi:hypothetical protein
MTLSRKPRWPDGSAITDDELHNGTPKVVNGKQWVVTGFDLNFGDGLSGELVIHFVPYQLAL